jgi:hypothetical protein
MKKIYVSPRAHCTHVEVENIVATSTLNMKITSSEQVENNDEIGVKANRTENYDVWNDDWSK